MGRKMASVEASCLSPSVMSWFGQELETRGIDAVIYTRYILSILQQEDSGDVEHWEAQFFPPGKMHPSPSGFHLHHDPSPPPTTRTSPASGSRGRAVTGKGRKTDKKKDRSAEELKKLAAVECLMSVSDQVSVLWPVSVCEQRGSVCASENQRRLRALFLEYNGNCLLFFQESGIENLVDELYLKLKEQEALRGTKMKLVTLNIGLGPLTI